MFKVEEPKGCAKRWKKNDGDFPEERQREPWPFPATRALAPQHSSWGTVKTRDEHQIIEQLWSILFVLQQRFGSGTW